MIMDCMLCCSRRRYESESVGMALGQTTYRTMSLEHLGSPSSHHELFSDSLGHVCEGSSSGLGLRWWCHLGEEGRGRID